MTLLNLSSEINTIHQTFTKELDFPIRQTDVTAQKIDDIILNIYEIVVEAFLLTKKANWIRFFEETFSVANISLKIVFKILFFVLNNTDIDFLGQELY